MKQPIEIVNARRDKIFSELVKNGIVNVSDLSVLLEVSEPTIRRDLMFFEHKSLIERFYGGARLISENAEPNPNQDFSLIKNALAKRAAEYINSGDTIFINTSSTAILVLKYLEDKDVTVITNNGNALLATYGDNVTVILTGGELTPSKRSMSGDFAIQTLQQIYVSKTILGCSSFSIEGGVTSSIHREVSINQIMLNNCRGERIILADHTKLGHSSSYSTGSLNDVDILITDTYADPHFVEKLEANSRVRVDRVFPSKIKSTTHE